MNATQLNRIATAITFSMISVYGASAEQGSAHGPLPPPSPSEKRLQVIDWTPSAVTSSDCSHFFVGNGTILVGSVDKETGEINFRRVQNGWSEYPNRYWVSTEHCVHINGRSVEANREADRKLRQKLYDSSIVGRNNISTYDHESVYSRSQTYHRGELYTRDEVNMAIERALIDQRHKFEGRLQQVMGFLDQELKVLRDEVESLRTQR